MGRSWTRLVRASAGLSALVEMARGGALGDRESAAIGIALGVVVALTFRERRAVATAGWIGVAALLVNQAAWMWPATWSLTSAAPSLGGAAVPVLLSVTAALGLASSVLRWRSTTDDVPRAILPVAVAVLLALTIAVPAAGRNAVGAQPGDIRLVTRDVVFRPDHLTAAAGDVGVVVKNDDLFWHTFTVNKLNANLRIATGGTRRIVLPNLAPGIYKFVCAIPGHEQAGMTGTLVVT